MLQASRMKHTNPNEILNEKKQQFIVLSDKLMLHNTSLQKEFRVQKATPTQSNEFTGSGYPTDNC